MLPASLSGPPLPALWVEWPGFGGTLDALASALRSGNVAASEVPLLRLTRDLLERVARGRLSAEEHAELLPALAAVIALKARLLLPQLPAAPIADLDAQDADNPPEDWDVLSGVQALAELDHLVALLSQRRAAREGLIAPQPLALTWPRRVRPPDGQAGLAKLLKAARSAVREVEVPLLTRERLTLAGALRALRAFGRLKHFTFFSVPVSDWGERATYFSALLEGVREGTFAAEQPAAFEDIQVHCLVDAESEDGGAFMTRPRVGV